MPMNEYGFQIGQALGGIQVELRSATQAIERLGETIEDRMEDLGERIEEAIDRAKPPAEVSPMSRAERWVKVILTYGIPLSVAWATGNLEKALELFKAIK